MPWEAALQLGVLRSNGGACILGVAQVHVTPRPPEERGPFSLHASADSTEQGDSLTSGHASGSMVCLKAQQMSSFALLHGPSREKSDAEALSQYVYVESWKCDVPAPCGPTGSSRKPRVQRLVCQDGAGKPLVAARVARAELGREATAVMKGLALLQRAHAARNAKKVCDPPYCGAPACVIVICKYS